VSRVPARPVGRRARSLAADRPGGGEEASAERGLDGGDRHQVGDDVTGQRPTKSVVGHAEGAGERADAGAAATGPLGLGGPREPVRHSMSKTLASPEPNGARGVETVRQGRLRDGRGRLRLLPFAVGGTGPQSDFEARFEQPERLSRDEHFPVQDALDGGEVDAREVGDSPQAPAVHGRREAPRHLRAVPDVGGGAVLERAVGPRTTGRDEARGGVVVVDGHAATVGGGPDGPGLTSRADRDTLLHRCNTMSSEEATTVRNPSHPASPAIRPNGQPVNSQRPGAVGTLTHSVVAVLAARPAGRVGGALATECYRVASPLVAPGHASRRHAVIFEAVGHCVTYLIAYRPAAPWTLHAAEHPVPGGRIDLVWMLPDGAVLYDEIKTTHVGATSPDPEWLRQTRRYAEAGAATHGTAFRGVRLVVLGAPATSQHVTPTGGSARSPPPRSTSTSPKEPSRDRHPRGP